jgi:hypothetical protein
MKKYGKEFLIGTGATMAFAYAFEKLNSISAKKEASAASTPAVIPNSSITPNTANTATNPNSPAYATNPASTDPNYSTATNPTYPTSTVPTYSTTTDPTAQTQNGYQQRAVDRDLPADIFGEPHLESRFIESTANGIVIISGSSEARSTSDNKNKIKIKIR